MKHHIISKCAQILIKDWAGNKSRPTFHYSFAVRKNKILAIGKAQPDNPSIIVLNKQLEILNLRINRHGKFRFCKPCVNCQKLLDHYCISKVSWSINLPEDDHKVIMLDGYDKINIENPCFVKKIS